MKVKGEFMGQKEQMKLEVIQKKENKKLVTKQTEGPFKRWGEHSRISWKWKQYACKTRY